MAYFLPEPAPGKCNLTAKNRVWGFFAEPNKTHPENRRQTLEPRRENRPSTTPIASGVFFYGYRYYDANTGRWVNRDPIGESGGVNLYGILNNVMINNWDVLGNKKFEKNEINTETMPVDVATPKEEVYLPDKKHHGITFFIEPGRFAIVGNPGAKGHLYEWNQNLLGWGCNAETLKLVGGKAGISSFYANWSTDVESTKKHERIHAAIFKKYWNMFVDEINWVEGNWAKGCAVKAGTYVHATYDLREAQGNVEHAELDLSLDQTDTERILKHKRATEKRDKLKVIYDTALKDFMTDCKGKNNPP